MRQNELYHHGIKGQKWGVRRFQNKDGTLTSKGKYAARVARGHAGPGVYATKKRQLEGDKKDLEYLNKGGHLSVGLTKKRQAAYDARDKKRLEKRIAKNEDGSRTTGNRNNSKNDDKKLVGNLTKKDAKKIGARFLGSVAIRTVAELTATKTGKDWISAVGDKGASVLDLYNGYTIATKGIVPSISNTAKKAQKKYGSRISNNNLVKVANNDMRQQQINNFMDTGRQFTQMQLQQNNMVATNQIMGFY